MSELQTGTAVRLFLRSVSRRLWWIRIVATARSALWPGSLALLTLALAHRIAIPITPWVTVLTGIVIALWAGRHAPLRRPSPAEAAAIADRAFNGQALMTTAAGCLKQPSATHAAATAIVLEQANAIARSKQTSIRREIRPVLSAMDTTALVPLFAALVLFMQPSDERRIAHRSSQTASSAVLQSEASDNSSDDVAAIRQELALNTDSSGLKPLADSETLRHTNTADPLADANNRIAIDSANSTLPGSTSVAVADAGNSAGDALPGLRESSKSTVADPELGQALNIEAGGQIKATFMASGNTYNDGATTQALSMSDIQAAAAPESARIQTTLTYAQARYTAHYLEAIGGTDD